MRRATWVGMLMLAMTSAMAGSTRAQVDLSISAPPIYSAPGYYGTVWGVPSYGMKVTKSSFASPFGGVGYSYGYGDYTYLPGPLGGALWNPGEFSPAYTYAPGQYRTFPAIPVPEYPGYTPPFGYYAPGFGPGPMPRN